MLLQAAKDFNINLSESWMIGDSENDIMAGKATRCRTALVGEGDFGSDIKSDCLKAASKLIIGNCETRKAHSQS